MQAPVGIGSSIAPGPKHSRYRTPQLSIWILREIGAGLGLHRRFVFSNDFLPVSGCQLSVVILARLVLQRIENVFKDAVVNLKHHIRVHLNKAAIAIIGEPLIARSAGETCHSRIIQAKV